MSSSQQLLPPAIQRSGESLAAPAEAGQGAASLHGEVAPSIAQSVDEAHELRRRALIHECLRFVAETGDSEFSVVLGDALQLQADEATNRLGLICGHQSGLTQADHEFLRHIVAIGSAAWVHAAKVISHCDFPTFAAARHEVQ